MEEEVAAAAATMRAEEIAEPMAANDNHMLSWTRSICRRAMDQKSSACTEPNSNKQPGGPIRRRVRCASPATSCHRQLIINPRESFS